MRLLPVPQRPLTQAVIWLSPRAGHSLGRAVWPSAHEVRGSGTLPMFGMDHDSLGH